MPRNAIKFLCVTLWHMYLLSCYLLHGWNLSVDSNLQVERSSHLCYNFSVAFLFAGIHVSVRYYPKRYCKGAVPMLHKTCTNSFHCPVEATLQLIGGKYKTLILWHLIDQTLRFNQLQKLLPQATPKMLTQQLRELETDGLIIRTVYPVVPPKVEYRLSDFGATIIPVLQAMCDWGDAYLMQQQGAVCPQHG